MSKREIAKIAREIKEIKAALNKTSDLKEGPDGGVISTRLADSMKVGKSFIKFDMGTIKLYIQDGYVSWGRDKKKVAMSYKVKTAPELAQLLRQWLLRERFFDISPLEDVMAFFNESRDFELFGNLFKMNYREGFVDQDWVDYMLGN